MSLRVNPTLLSDRGTVKLHCKYCRWKVSQQYDFYPGKNHCSAVAAHTTVAVHPPGLASWRDIALGRETLMSQCLTGFLHVLLVLFHLCPSVLSAGFLSAQADTTHPLTKHRKIASSFRDSSLFDIFTLSCNLLKQVRKQSFVISLGGCMLGQQTLG